MSAKSQDFMSGEVFFTEYSHLPSPRILESRFKMKERALAETIDNLTSSKSGAIIDEDLSQVKAKASDGFPSIFSAAFKSDRETQ
ncbi:hypothetical protein PNOK_0696400 [Pyrrhoderma noxium]|uniref:Uncharacterized protein n=1 Tax=Pyrrhoderma noxium TaxID=2282107 RepID=A0A286UBF0_9AGAM|nr:hypothetical protein PNOK_0696400 [Pyrrhoderma noxium]